MLTFSLSQSFFIYSPCLSAIESLVIGLNICGVDQSSLSAVEWAFMHCENEIVPGKLDVIDALIARFITDQVHFVEEDMKSVMPAWDLELQVTGEITGQTVGHE